MTVAWSVPPMWEGETVAVLATGPSLTQKQCDSVRHLPCIAVNDAYKMAPFAEMIYAADIQWWALNPDALSFKGLKVTCMNDMQLTDVKVLKQGGLEGFDPSPDAIRTGGNSGYQAVHIAIHAKAAKILLFGFDMGGTHFFGPHKAPLRNTDTEVFTHWIPRFEALKNRGSEIINCTPKSALKCFPTDTSWAI